VPLHGRKIGESRRYIAARWTSLAAITEKVKYMMHQEILAGLKAKMREVVPKAVGAVYSVVWSRRARCRLCLLVLQNLVRIMCVASSLAAASDKHCGGIGGIPLIT
jgi:hypothetical protein